MATQKKPTVCRLLTMQSHVPVKMAASHTDSGHNSTPESSPTIAGLDATLPEIRLVEAIDERIVIKKTDKIPASNKNFFMLSPPIAIDRIKRVLLAIHRFAAEFLFAWHCILRFLFRPSKERMRGEGEPSDKNVAVVDRPHGKSSIHDLKARSAGPHSNNKSS
jgi:hypothetical protein